MTVVSNCLWNVLNILSSWHPGSIAKWNLSAPGPWSRSLSGSPAVGSLGMVNRLNDNSHYRLQGQSQLRVRDPGVTALSKV